MDYDTIRRWPPRGLAAVTRRTAHSRDCRSTRHRLAAVALEPLRAVRFAYLPVLAIYGAAGALGLISVADSFWVKGALELTAVDLAAIAVWLQLPWIAKMVVSEVVDAPPLRGLSRRTYILAGAGLVAAGLVMLAGAAGGWLAFMTKERIYVLAQLLIVIGGVIQEVVADALVPGMVARIEADGSPRPEATVSAELAMIEVLARLTYTGAALICGGLAGRLAASYPAQSVYLAALVVPLLSVVGSVVAAVSFRLVACDRLADIRRWLCARRCRTSAGPRTGAICSGGDLRGSAAGTGVDAAHSRAGRRRGRSPPDRDRCRARFRVPRDSLRREGYRWFGIDRLGFDENSFGTLQMTGTGVGLVLMWLLARAVSERPIQDIILLLTAVAVLLLMPMLVLAHGGHQWTGHHLGVGPRGIALIDEAAQSPLALMATVPVLALVAVHAPHVRRATWFAVVASLISLAIVGGQLITKYLNMLFPIERGGYDHLPWGSSPGWWC